MRGWYRKTNEATIRLPEVRGLMNRQPLSFCSLCVILCFLFTLLCPDDAFCFDTDTLKTTGIIMGITFGVALVVVLVVGTIRDMKRDQGDEDEDDDVWSQHPVFRTLGYKPLDHPLFIAAPAPPEDLSETGLMGQRKMHAFLQGGIDTIGFGDPHDPSLRLPCPFTLGCVAGESLFSYPDTALEGIRSPFSLWPADERS
jgi:hypothetical protein